MVGGGFLEEAAGGYYAGAVGGTTSGPSPVPGRFMQELTEMLGFRPYRFYFYMWKFVSPLCMAVLTTASIIQLGVTPPGYSAWIKEEVRGGGPKPPGCWHLPRPLGNRQKRYRAFTRCQALPPSRLHLLCNLCHNPERGVGFLESHRWGHRVAQR